MSGAGASVADCSAVAGEPVVIGAATLHLGDCADVLATLPEASIDAVVCDPPYGLAFMGKAWDHGVPSADVWRAVLRVLKPGGHLLAFGGTRTYHRMACAIEDAGFEIRDQIGWVYGSGFPKSLNLDGDFAGWGTALKPAWEPVVLARKPLAGTVAANVQAHGTGALNIDGCRVAIEDDLPGYSTPGKDGGSDVVYAGAWSDGPYAPKMPHPDSTRHDARGRWPANLIHDGSAEVVALFPDFLHGPGNQKPTPRGSNKNGVTNFGNTERKTLVTRHELGMGGSPARFFYCAKASRADRDDGCDALRKRPLRWSAGEANPGSFQSPGTDKSARNHHPTVKPTDLMRYLCRLITPPGGVVLDPFMGSGSTGRGALLEDFRFVGIEREPDYFAIAQARIAAVQGQGDLFAAGPSP